MVSEFLPVMDSQGTSRIKRFFHISLARRNIPIYLLNSFIVSPISAVSVSGHKIPLCEQISTHIKLSFIATASPVYLFYIL